MIVFDRKSKELTLPKSLGNVAVDVASGTTDAITRDELRETVSRANERTLAAAERYAAEQAGGAVSLANAYTDGVVAESAESTLDQAKDYTDSAITLTDYDYVLDAGPNADDTNKFLQWASQFDEDDLKKIRVFHRMRVLRYDNGNLSQGWMYLQGVDATYMNNDRIYVSRLNFTANQAPSWDERAYDLNTFVNSAQTEEIIDSDYIYLTGGTNVNYWTVTRQSIEYLRSRVEALSVPDSITGQKYHKLHAFLLIDGVWYDFRPVYVSANLDRIYFQCITLTETTLRVEDNKLTVMYFTLWQNATSLPEGTIKTRQISMS